MKKKKNVIKTLCEGGHGSEASVLVQARKMFPGFGGTIKSKEVAVAARREEYNQTPFIGHHLFFVHLILKKLDDFHHWTNLYDFPHIARPLGSEDGCYFYEWVHGKDTFPWEYTRPDRGRDMVILAEWGAFMCAFEEKGILLGSHRDVVESEGIMSQNIVHQLYRGSELDLNYCWKRIDFGPRSLYIDYDILWIYLTHNSSELRRVLKKDRYNLMVLAYQYLRYPNSLISCEMENLHRLTRLSRISTLRHLRSRLFIG